MHNELTKQDIKKMEEEIEHRKLVVRKEALEAVKNGADCLGVGAMFSTSTKTDVDVLPKEVLKDICEAVDVPIVAIGGIGKSNILELAGTKVDGIALVSAIFASEDIENECRILRKLSEEMVIV